MTVIAYDPNTKSIACDSMAADAERKSYIKKFRKMKDGRIAFIAGNFVYGLRAIDFIQDKLPIPNYMMDEIDLVIFNPKTGTCFAYDNDAPTGARVRKKQAWGTGMDVAIGSLMTGADAEYAAKVAASHCKSCGGKVYVFKKDS